jgi:cytochrome c551/c552
MKNLILFLMFIGAIVFLYGFTFSMENNNTDGKKIFTDKKCNSCHTVEVAGIESKKKDASDLSAVGSEMDAEFMAKYLVQKEKLNDKVHKPAFKGTDEELETLSEWLVSLEKAEKKK